MSADSNSPRQVPDIQVVTYDGSRPADADLRHHLPFGPGDEYTYVVATTALEHVRRELAPPHQVKQAAGDEDRGGPRFHLVFHKAIRHFMNAALLTRAEERVTLGRAIRQVAAADPDLATVLRHDVFAWRDALASMDEMGVDLAGGLPAELDQRVANPTVGTLLGDLQQAWRAERQQTPAGRTFEEAAREFIAREYRPTQVIVMEGFTYFTPLQRHFIDAAAAAGARIYLIHPWREPQAFGLAVLRRTFDPFVGPGGRVQLPAAAVQAPVNSLQQLQAGLFSDAAPPAAAGEDPERPSVTLTVYAHRQEEVEACLDRLQQALEGRRAGDLAIVARNPAEFMPLLRDAAEIRDLRDATGAQVRLGIAPRELLLTPLGRFALTLYQIWDGEDVRMSPDQFEAILASGWLGAQEQDTVETFEAVRPQVFTPCRAGEEWEAAFDHVAAIAAELPADSRVPAAAVTDRIVYVWRGALDRIRTICRNLFSVPDRSIGQHIEALLDEMTRLAPEVMREAEREVLHRIQEVLLRLAEATSVAMSTDEFGEVLNSLVREYDRPEDESPEAVLEDPREILVTSPEGIDRYDKRVVFYLGIDDHRVPRPAGETWPLLRDAAELDAHLETERYLFLAVANAATEQLHLSYARGVEGRQHGPSIYLRRAAEVLGTEIAQPDRAPAGELALPQAQPAQPRRPARRREYRLSEVAHFALCPFRYKLERLDIGARRYRNEYQLKFIAQGVWLDALMRRLEAVPGATEGAEATLERFLEAMRDTEDEVRSIFSGLRDLVWHEIRARVRDTLVYEVEHHTTDFPTRVQAAQPSGFVLVEGDRAVQVDASVRHAIRRGIIPYAFTSDLLHEEWLLPAIRGDEDQPPQTVVEDVPVFSGLKHAVQWWDRALKTAFEFQTSSQPGALRTVDQQNRFEQRVRPEYQDLTAAVYRIVERVETGPYPKNPGNQCGMCPVRADCTGLPEQEVA